MKKTLLLCAAIAASFTTASAQVSIGPRLGLNIASVKAAGGDKEIRSEINDVYNSLTGIQTGLAINFVVSEKVSLQPEILYSQMGLTAKDSGMKVTLRQSYLQVPLLLKINVLPESETQFYFIGGPYAGYWLSGKMKGKQNGQTVKVDYEFDDDYNYDGVKDNRLDFGAAIGAGIGRQVGSGTLSLDLRYAYGFSDVISYKNGRDNEMPRLGTRNLNFNLTYLFTLGE